MSANNGVIRIGKKGLKKFAFGEDGPVFEVDVVTAFQVWLNIDKELRGEDDIIKAEDMRAYHEAAVEFANHLSDCEVTTAEALDFIARLREQYDEVAGFFLPRSPEERVLPATLGAELRFSVEDANSAPLMN